MQTVAKDSVDVMVWTSLALNYNGVENPTHTSLLGWYTQRQHLGEKGGLNSESFTEVNNTAGEICQLSTGLDYPGESEHDIIVYRGIDGIMGVFSLYQSGSTDTCSVDGIGLNPSERKTQINEKLEIVIPQIFQNASVDGSGVANMLKLVDVTYEEERRKIVLKFFDALIGIHFMLKFKKSDGNYLPQLLDTRKLLENIDSIVTSLPEQNVFVPIVVEVHQLASKLRHHQNINLYLNYHALAFVTTQLHWLLTGVNVLGIENNVAVNNRSHHTISGRLFDLIVSFSHFV